MTNHKELVRHLAEEIAIWDYNRIMKCMGHENAWAIISNRGKELEISSWMPLAEKIVVEFGSKMFEDGYSIGVTNGLNGYSSPSYMTKAKKEFGLTPDQLPDARKGINEKEQEV